MPKILVAPFSAKLRTGQPNAKNPSIYWWQIVVQQLNALCYEVIQIGGLGEQRIVGTVQHVVNQPLRKVRELVNECDTWISVDSLLPHLCWAYKLKSGVVVWSVSDPMIWGHIQNTNVVKSRDCLRPLQYQDWISQPYNEDAFVSPQEVVDAVIESLKSANRTTPASTSLPVAEPSQISSTT